MHVHFGLIACSPEPVLPHVSLDQARAENKAGLVLMTDIREPQELTTGVVQAVVLLICGLLRSVQVRRRHSFVLM